MAHQTMHHLKGQNYAAIHLVPLKVVIVWFLYISINKKETKSENEFVLLREPVAILTAHITQTQTSRFCRLNEVHFPPILPQLDVNN